MAALRRCLTLRGECAAHRRAPWGRPRRPRIDPETTVDLLARSITHELRQPLALIAGAAELLATRDLPEAERSALLAELRGAAARLSGRRLERPDGLRPRRLGPEELLDLRPGDPAT
jgi:signal transduction histidine kinase